MRRPEDGGGNELVWIMTWLYRANTAIEASPACRRTRRPKYPAVARYAYERPLVWFDDDFGLHPARRDAFVHKRRHLTTALIHVDPATGIGAHHLDEARKAFSRNP
ncbi:hypothetical protein ACFWN2_26440 [Lentzea sp. NPDC058436]|uniref:hypothetical protein n=1 Tax=Lentzea sp. NPDC058436 TaxID=3346499 RepID=UPI003664BB03